MQNLEKRIQGHLDPQSPRLEVDYQQGLWIPIDILNDTSLTYAERHLLAYIRHLDQSHEGGMPCYASNEWFGKIMGLKVQSTKNLIGRLVKKKKIKLLGFNGTYRFLQFIR